MIRERVEQKLKKDFLKLAVLTVITVIIWLGMTTYKALTKSQIKPAVKKLLIPLTSTLDLDTMKKISQREVVPVTDWDSLKPAGPAILLVPTADEAILPLDEASPSGQTE